MRLYNALETNSLMALREKCNMTSLMSCTNFRTVDIKILKSKAVNLE